MSIAKLPVQGPEDLLSYIPHALGYWPEESLVCVTLGRSRVGATLRLDLPRARSRAALASYARQAASYLRSDGSADGVLAAVFTAEAWARGAAPPHRRLLDALTGALADAGLPIRDAWYLGPAAWRNYDCEDAECCPWPGRPLEDITGSRLSAELVYRGSSYEPDAAAAARTGSRALPADEAGRVAAAAAEYRKQIGTGWAEEQQFSAALLVWESLLGRTLPEPNASAVPDTATAGFLLASLDSVAVRDTVLVQAATGLLAAAAGARGCGLPGGPARAAEAVLPAGFAGPAPGADAPGGQAATGPVPGAVPGSAPGSSAGERKTGGKRQEQRPAALAAQYGAVLVGESLVRPDWERLERADRLLALLASCPGTDGRAAALTMRSWIEWCRGRGSRADALLAEALQAAPGYRLAVLLRELLSTGHLCAWARDRELAWQRASG
ncbi:DUF4192 family protein [Paenarthrobacter sp. DKR-5]|uniref:DUF4192 domain-containing protein n=1 Tax=Paenarthrobacter sp. DKR-5 TaxID=2835535 RepID=UPI001BDD11F7|nr:DUF4192 domain-containing protein [Paenarthrobacter sp. DKR-5]MBT1002109.1 DUF4192 family protein [Paenarthrobacter sp. DKR-5]